MPDITETYKGYEIRLRIMGKPPHTAMIRKSGAIIYESGDIEADTETGLRSAAQARIDRLLNQP
jgi:hypothetical protein